MKYSYKKYSLQFKKPGGTSRGVLYEKPTYVFIGEDADGRKAFGECNLFSGLGSDDRPGYEEKLQEVCMQLNESGTCDVSQLVEWPSIVMGVETLLRDRDNGFHQIIFNSSFVHDEKSIPINGLIWMGSKTAMLQQVEEKIKDGFSCLKLKIGAIDFKSELEILRFIRDRFSATELQIRVDANGAFDIKDALIKLEQLSAFDIHSIEQPIRAGQWQEMAALAEQSPVPVALDEELIGIYTLAEKEKMIRTISPTYLILKPALAGGFVGCDEWIGLAAKYNIGWWITSALESNIGLNAIAQYTFIKNNPLPQGLGTGQLYTNNFTSPLEIKNGKLFYNKTTAWDMSPLIS